MSRRIVYRWANDAYLTRDEYDVIAPYTGRLPVCDSWDEILQQARILPHIDQEMPDHTVFALQVVEASPADVANSVRVRWVTVATLYLGGAIEWHAPPFSAPADFDEACTAAIREYEKRFR